MVKKKKQKNSMNSMEKETDIDNHQKQRSGPVRVSLIILSSNVKLSCSVQVEDTSEYIKTTDISMIVISNHCDMKSVVELRKSKFYALMFDEDQKPSKTDLSWMRNITRVHRPETTVLFGQMQVPPIPNTMDSILFRYFSANPPTKRETMAYELLRLCTLHDFPKSTGQSCIRLAQAAFFYEGKNDEVICFSCSVQLCGWQPRDIPLDRHRETSPNCLFIKGQNCGNVPICYTGSTSGTTEVNEASSTLSEFESVSSPATKSSNSDLSITKNVGVSNDLGYGSMRNRSSQPSQPSGSSDTPTSQTYITSSGSLSMTGILDTQTPNQYTVTSTNRNRAHYPEYVLVNDRLRSFDRGWPDYVSQTPQMMVESGFFFAGYEDCVRCFQCGIGLRNWEPPDSPHVEHARWSPKCPFLLGVKGQDFINLVLDAVAQLALRNEQAANTPPTHMASNPGKDVLLQTTQHINTAPRNLVTTGDAVGYVNETSAQTASPSPSDAIETEHAKKNVMKKGLSENEVRGVIEKIVEKDGLRGGDANKKMTILPSEVMELKKKNREMREMTVCKICLEEEVSIVFLPCGHLVACAQCAPALSRCAVCRKPITGTICAHLDV